MTPVEPPSPGAPGNGHPVASPRPSLPGPRPPQPPVPEHEQRLAERRLLDEMARHRRAEQQQMQAVKWGCISVLAAIVLLMVIGFMFF